MYIYFELHTQQHYHTLNIGNFKKLNLRRIDLAQQLCGYVFSTVKNVKSKL